MHKILLVGAYGQRNPGDDALAAAFSHALPTFDVTVVSSDPRLSEARSGHAAVSSHDPLAVARAVMRTDAVVFGGGTVFKTLHPATGRAPNSLLARSLAVVQAARVRQRPVAMVGVGAGRLTQPVAKRLARDLTRSLDLLILRDEESAHALKACGVAAPLRVGADAAWPILTGSRAAVPNNGLMDDAVLVALSHLAGHGPSLANLVDVLAQTLWELSAGGSQVLLQPWQVGTNGTDDLDLAYALRSRVPGSAILPPPENLAEAAAVAGQARVAICLRFHSIVAAAAAGTPLVAVAHEGKLAGLARRLDQPSVSITCSPPDLLDAVGKAVASGGPSPAAVARETAMAQEGFELLRLLLGGDSLVDAHNLTGLRLEPTMWGEG